MTRKTEAIVRIGTFLAGCLVGYGLVLLIPTATEPEPPKAAQSSPVPRKWSSWDRRALPYQMTVGGVLGPDGLTWPEVEGPEPPLAPYGDGYVISSRVEEQE